jgi:hypothetical protein
MEKEIRRQMIIGTLLAIGIFIGIIAVINGLNLAATFLKARTQPSESNEATIPISSENDISSTKTIPELVLPEKEFTLYFPSVVQNSTTNTKIQLQNNTGEIITDAETTVMGKGGDWHRYRALTVNSDPYILDTKNLANLPPGLNPGVLVITSNHPLAGISTVTNNGLENNPIAPYLELARDLYFRFDRNRDATISQNSLVITNFDSRIAEIQLSFSGKKPEISNTTIGPLELKPWETKVFNLRQILQGKASLDDFDNLLVSGTAANFIGVIAEVDQTGQTWKNFAVGEVR